jgi:hypothetical protein
MELAHGRQSRDVDIIEGQWGESDIGKDIAEQLLDIAV